MCLASFTHRVFGRDIEGSTDEVQDVLHWDGHGGRKLVPEMGEGKHDLPCKSPAAGQGSGARRGEGSTVASGRGISSVLKSGASGGRERWSLRPPVLGVGSLCRALRSAEDLEGRKGGDAISARSRGGGQVQSPPATLHGGPWPCRAKQPSQPDGLPRCNLLPKGSPHSPGLPGPQPDSRSPGEEVNKGSTRAHAGCRGPKADPGSS